MKYRLFIVVFLAVMFSSHVFANDVWTYITEINGEELGGPVSMAVEDDGTIWVCFMQRVYRYNENIWTDESANFPDNPLPYVYIRIAVSLQGNVWFCYSNKLVKYDGETWQYFEYEDSTISDFMDMGVDPQENVWCCSDDGVYKFDGTNWEKHTTQDGLMGNGVTRLKVSPEGDVWVRYQTPYLLGKRTGIYSRYFGVSRFNGTDWETFNTEDGLISDRVDDFAFGPNGEVYVSWGSWDERGIMRYNGSKWESIADNIGGSLLCDKNGVLWISDNDYASVYTYNGIEFTKLPDKAQEVLRYKTTKIFDQNGNLWHGVSGGILIYDFTTGITDNDESERQQFILHNNYPNPFNPATTMSYTLANPGHVSLYVYNSTGQKIATLVDTHMSAGEHSAKFDGRGLASGMYFYRFEAGGFEKSGKMILVK